MAAGGSRERPSGLQLYGPIRTNRNALSENIALGDSREPPVAAICERIERWNKYARLYDDAPKRLPWHLQALGDHAGNNATTFFEDEDDDE